MTSKPKSKTKLAHEKDGTPWIVDEHGNKIKKVRKKVRRRNSNPEGTENSPGSFDLSQFDDSESGNDTSAKKCTSFRTEATAEMSNHSSSITDPLRSPTAKTPKKSKKSRSQKGEKDDKWWHIDDDLKAQMLMDMEDDIEDVEQRIMMKKSSSKNNRINMMNQIELHRSEDGRIISSSCSVMTPRTMKKKKKKAGMSKSKSVRAVKHVPMDDDSGPDSPVGTVNTTGTGSVRPKPRKMKSQSDMYGDLEQSSSGDLDLLMSQSVHEHIRKVPSTEKPKLGKSKSTLGKIGKKLGKAGKAAGKAALSISVHGGKNRERDQSLSRSNHSGLNHSIPGRTKPLPDDIREIDGVLWRVDELGNKLNKVRHKGSRGYLTDDTMSEPEPDDLNASWSAYNSDDNSKGSFSARRRGTRAQRRGSAGSIGAGSASNGMPGSASNGTPGSENDIYVTLNDTQKQTPKQKRSRSMSHMSETTSPRGRSNKKNDTDNLVQNLQHRLKNSEKEIARLCRVTMDQQEKMAEAERELKRAKDKIKHFDHEKQALTMELDVLKQQIENKRTEQANAMGLDGPSNQDLLERILQLEDDNEALEKQVSNEKMYSRQRLEAKEEEVRFLEQELERMRTENGEKQFAYLQQKSVQNEDESTFASSTQSPRSRQSNSMVLVGKILGNHLKDKAETEKALQKEEIRNLQARVFQLQQSNEKLTKELKEASLVVNDDDDEELRMAKEAAMKAASLQQQQSQPKPRRNIFARRNRSGDSDSDDNSVLSMSFRGGVGELMKSRSIDNLSQSFRHTRPKGLY